MDNSVTDSMDNIASGIREISAKLNEVIYTAADTADKTNMWLGIIACTLVAHFLFSVYKHFAK